MKLYTRTGDTGTTSLVGGTRVAKTDLRLHAYGTIDELCAAIGLLSTYIDPHSDEAHALARVQDTLFVVGTYLATEDSHPELLARWDITATQVADLEHDIDRTDALLPPLRSFVIPGGARSAATCHLCRTICRRAERHILELDARSPLSPTLKAYINRLSDFLFALARRLNQIEKKDEILWRSNRN